MAAKSIALWSSSTIWSYVHNMRGLSTLNNSSYYTDNSISVHQGFAHDPLHNWTKFGACMWSYVFQRNFTQIACMASQKWAFKYFAFCHFSLCVIIQSIITWAFFNVLRNGFHHFTAHRICFHLVYLLALFDGVDNYPRLLNFDLLFYQKVLIRSFCYFLWILARYPPISCKSFSLGSRGDYEICAVL